MTVMTTAQAAGVHHKPPAYAETCLRRRALQAYLDHRNIQHTVRYTELSPMRFKDFSASKIPVGSYGRSLC